MEVRVAQAVFRRRVGERCGSRCAVTGSKIRGLLDAAYLPGKDWRKYNDADDGILLRTDIHRLVDAGLASIDKGMFTISKAAHVKQARAEYAKYEGRILV